MVKRLEPERGSTWDLPTGCDCEILACPCRLVARLLLCGNLDQPVCPITDPGLSHAWFALRHKMARIHTEPKLEQGHTGRHLEEMHKALVVLREEGKAMAVAPAVLDCLKSDFEEVQIVQNQERNAPHPSDVLNKTHMHAQLPLLCSAGSASPLVNLYMARRTVFERDYLCLGDERLRSDGKGLHGVASVWKCGLVKEFR